MTLRLFAALDIPDDVATHLLGLMRDIPGAAWRPRENLHITLRFFGDLTEPVAEDLDLELARIAEATAPFEIALKGAGSFGGAEPHAIWIGVEESAALRKLAGDCERAARRMGVQLDAQKFTPHVTMAYLRGGVEFSRVQAFEQRYALWGSPLFHVGGFGLYSSVTRKSAPSLYRLEAEYALLGS